MEPSEDNGDERGEDYDGEPDRGQEEQERVGQIAQDSHRNATSPNTHSTQHHPMTAMTNSPSAARRGKRICFISLLLGGGNEYE